jgi:hypothetical protein
LSENEPELELFLNKLRDNEFEAMMQETLQESEANFENYANQHGLPGELESMVAQPNFDNIVNGYFEASIGHLVPAIQGELDNFSNYIQNNVPAEAEYETFKCVVDSYQPVHSEDFVRRIARRVGRAVKGVVKRGIRLAGRVARGAIGIGRFIVTGPLRIVVRRFMRWIRDNIARLFRSLVARVIQRLPPVRPYFSRAAKSIGIGEYESFASETDIRSAEMLSELETESSVEYESLAGGSISPRLNQRLKAIAQSTRWKMS